MYEKEQADEVAIDFDLGITDSFLVRTFVIIDDGDYNRARERLEEILDKQPRCAEAYVGLLLCDLGLSRVSDLSITREPFHDNKNYSHALEHADEALREYLMASSIKALERYERDAAEAGCAEDEDEYEPEAKAARTKPRAKATPRANIFPIILERLKHLFANIGRGFAWLFKMIFIGIKWLALGIFWIFFMIFLGIKKLWEVVYDSVSSMSGRGRIILFSTLGGVLLVGVVTLIIMLSIKPQVVYEEYDDHLVVTGRNEGVVNLIIPEKINGKPVTKIADNAFAQSTDLASVTIPTTLESIGANAFEGCEALRFVYYCGTSEEWQRIGGKDEVNNTPVYFYSTAMPPVGDYWRYVFGTPTIWTEFVHDCIDKDENALCDICEKDVSSGPNDFTYTNENGEITITGYNGAGTTVVIPARIGGVAVTSIGEKAFEDKSGITKITIPDSIKSIGKWAFWGCSSLTSVTVPDSVTSIYVGAFGGCTSLTSITIPFVGGDKREANDTYQYPFGFIFGIDEYEGGAAVTQYYFGSSTTTDTSNTFYIPKSLRSVTVTGGNILGGAFFDCNMLTSITIPSDITSIGPSAFWGCAGLTSIAIPDNVTSIGSYAFYECTGLNRIIIPSGVPIIDECTFSGCVGLTSITIPNNVTRIDDRAFADCISLTDVSLSSSVTEIGSGAFNRCESLTSITIPNSVTGIGYYAFEGCTSLESISLPTTPFEDSYYNYYLGHIFGASEAYYSNEYVPSSLKTVTITAGSRIPSEMFYNCSNLTNIVIPDSVTSIGSSAFSGCSSMESITLGKSITSDHISTLYNCSNLASVTISEENESLKAIDGVVYSKDGASLLLYPKARRSTTFTIPSTVTEINSNAFNNCISLLELIIPDSVSSIGKGALSGCASLERLTIPFVGTSAAPSTDAEQAFGTIFGTKEYSGSVAANQYYDNYNSYTYYLPESLSTVNVLGGKLAYGAFYNCKSIANITIGDSVTEIGEYAFKGCKSLTNIKLGSSVKNIYDYAFSGCYALSSITLPSSLTGLGANAFGKCYKLVEVINHSTLNISTTSYGLNAMEVHTEPSKLVSLNDYLFYTYNDVNYLVGYTGNSTELTLPSDYNGAGYKINKYAFYGSLALTSINTGGATEIGEHAFDSCGSLARIIIGDSVADIGGYAFSDCASLTSVSMGNGVTRIASYTFSRCYDLAEIVISDSVTDIEDRAFDACTGLTSVTIGAGVTRIGYYAFGNCSKLSTVTFINPDGWWRASSETATSGTAISNLSNTITAATYLKSTYSTYYWGRSSMTE